MGRKDKATLFSYNHWNIYGVGGENYVRFERRTTVESIKLTPTVLKMKNLFALYDALHSKVLERAYSEKFIERFCGKREISRSNYLRLLSLYKVAFNICDDRGNSVAQTDMNRKYIVLLWLYDGLKNAGINGRQFCDKVNIGRTTFFRYLLLVENYVNYEYDDLGLGFDENRLYRITKM